ncbi:MAG: nucleotidyltransferase [Bacteroidales bacterium]|nr:nucleotidyltransferase [Bacteroidales bacterium]MBN2762031.1 nucleotidyltransferase [Bacteroidales bacterium]
MKPSLIIMAAGMGSRYGGLKQVDRFGPSGETIVEYSIYDALRAGFGKIVMVVRKEFVNDFKDLVLNKAMRKADIEFVFQELENIPAGLTVPPDRAKPWGTGHAVMIAEKKINTPFAVINADDLYGANSLKVMADFLTQPQEDNVDNYCIVGYQLENTLSESGHVSRGVCFADDQGFLKSIVEHKKIFREDAVIKSQLDEKQSVQFTGKEIVSMNLMGFTPSLFQHLKSQFVSFIKSNINNLSAEFYLPSVVNEVVKEGKARVKLLQTNDKWFGVTYKEDRPAVINNLIKLLEDGVYPVNLWE